MQPQQKLTFGPIGIVIGTLTDLWNKNLLCNVLPPHKSCAVTQADYNKVSLFSYFTTPVKNVGSSWKAANSVHGC